MHTSFLLFRHRSSINSSFPMSAYCRVQSIDYLVLYNQLLGALLSEIFMGIILCRRHEGILNLLCLPHLYRLLLATLLERLEGELHGVVVIL